jgi:predicted DNA-binding transcriptional regulator AlpA
MIESEKYLLNANDVVDLLGVKRPTAYKIIRDANIRLSKAGKLTVRGKINRRYLLKMLDVSEV